MQRADGSLVWIALTVNPIMDAGGQVVESRSMVVDITERKKVEELLRISEERYALAQRAANIGSWDWNISTDTLQWSDQIEPMFGFATGEFGRTYAAFLDCVHPDDRKHVENSVNNAVKNDVDYDIEHRIGERGRACGVAGGVPRTQRALLQHPFAQQPTRQQNDPLMTRKSALPDQIGKSGQPIGLGQERRHPAPAFRPPRIAVRRPPSRYRAVVPGEGPGPSLPLRRSTATGASASRSMKSRSKNNPRPPTPGAAG